MHGKVTRLHQLTVQSEFMSPESTNAIPEYTNSQKATHQQALKTNVSNKLNKPGIMAHSCGPSYLTD